MNKSYFSILAAAVLACQEQGLSFQTRLAIYGPLVHALRELQDDPEPKLFPKDTAWTAACWTDEVARKAGISDATRGQPWMWSIWQLRMEDHPLALAYERGYLTVHREVILGHAMEAAGRMLRGDRAPSPLEVAKVIRVFSWQEEKLPKVFEQWVTNYMLEHNMQEDWKHFQSIDILLAAESSGRLYPTKA